MEMEIELLHREWFDGRIGSEFTNRICYEHPKVPERWMYYNRTYNVAVYYFEDYGYCVLSADMMDMVGEDELDVAKALNTLKLHAEDRIEHGEFGVFLNTTDVGEQRRLLSDFEKNWKEDDTKFEFVEFKQITLFPT